MDKRSLLGPDLVDVMRGGEIESRHRGALAIVDADGQLVLGIGDLEQRVFPRSAVKLLQALPLVESGAADHYGFDDAALALACASHSGEAAHVATAAGMLARAGADEHWLECGAHWPKSDTTQRSLMAAGMAPSALHNNCSGKHAGFVCLACHQALADGRDPIAAAHGYVEPGHPVMREVGAALAAMTGERLEQAPRGLDGCSIPTYALPLPSIALAFARVATGHGLAPQRRAAVDRLRAAIARAPTMLAGSGRFDTRIAEQLGERACVKTGAEGVYAAALPEQGWGVAIKVEDGQARASESVMAAVLAATLSLDDAQTTWIESLAEPVLHNWRGLEVGRLRPTKALREALAGLTRASRP